MSKLHLPALYMELTILTQSQVDCTGVNVERARGTVPHGSYRNDTCADMGAVLTKRPGFRPSGTTSKKWEIAPACSRCDVPMKRELMNPVRKKLWISRGVAPLRLPHHSKKTLFESHPVQQRLHLKRQLREFADTCQVGCLIVLWCCRGAGIQVEICQSLQCLCPGTCRFYRSQREMLPFAETAR